MLPKLKLSSIRFQNGSSALVWFTSPVKFWRNAEDLHPIRFESDVSASNRSRLACPVHDPLVNTSGRSRTDMVFPMTEVHC